MEKQYTPGQRFTLARCSELLFTHGSKSGDDAVFATPVVEVVKSRLKKKVRFKLIDGGFVMKHGLQIESFNIPSTLQVAHTFDAYLDDGWANVEIEIKDAHWDAESQEYAYHTKKDFVWMKLNKDVAK